MAESLPLLRSGMLEGIPGIVHAFTGCTGGVSADACASLNLSARVGDTREAVQENRGRLLRALGIPGAAWVSLKQVHKDDVCEVRGSASKSIEADGLWTRDRAAVIAVLVADCVPILLANEAGTAVAAVHAGWRGTELRIVARMIDRLRAAGIDPKSLRVGIGPAIGPCCFEVGPEVAAALVRAVPEAPSAVVVSVEGRAHADLWALNAAVAMAAGVPSTGIEQLRVCVACGPGYFSHRRDKGHTGRQAGVIGFAPVAR